MDFKEIFNNKPRCQHFHEDGKRCAADPQTNNKFCFMHDPGQKQKQSEARKKGGQMRFQPYEPKIPASFQYNPLKDRAQIDDFLDQLGLYLQRGEMDQRSVRSYLFLASLKLSVRKDEAAERRWAERRAERQAQRAGKEPKFFDTDLDGGTLHGTRQELVEYWKNRATELAAAQNPDAATRKPPQPGALPKASQKPRSDEPSYSEDSSELASPNSAAPPPKRPPQPVPASRGPIQAAQPVLYPGNLSEAEMERFRDEVYFEAVRKTKRSRWKRRQTWQMWK